MLSLPVLPDARAEVERCEPRTHSAGCTRCSRHRGVRHVCIEPDGEPGGLLVVGEYPSTKCDREGRSLWSPSGVWVRALVQKWWDGPAAFDLAVRCGGDRPTEGEVDRCRAHLLATIEEVDPVRVIALGQAAALALLGRTPEPRAVSSGGHGWLSDGTPVYLLPAPHLEMRGRHRKRQFELDLHAALTTDPRDAPPRGEVRLVQTVEDSEIAEASLRLGFGWDTETCGVAYCRGFRVLCLGASPFDDPGVSWVWDEEALLDARGDAVRRLLADDSISKGAHVSKFDQHAVWWRLGVEVRAPNRTHVDTHMLRKILDPDCDADLETAVELVGFGGHKDEMQRALGDAVARVRQAQQRAGQRTLFGGDEVDALAARHPDADPLTFAYAHVPAKKRNRYVGLDAMGVARLAPELLRRVDAEDHLRRAWREIYGPVTHAVWHVERAGFAVDLGGRDAVSALYAARLDDARTRLAAYGDFNPASPPQVAELLFEKLKLKAKYFSRKTKKPSVAAKALKHLLGQHPIIPDLMEFSRLEKLRGSFVDALPKHVRDDGRIHPNVKPVGTETGRFTCVDPNLQQVPSEKRSEEGRRVKDLFVAGPGCVLISFDYSQIELRVAAVLSGDKAMRQVFLDGVDYHRRTAELAAKLMGWSSVGDRERQIAKAFNFGLLYGQGDAALAAAAGITVREAALFRRAVFGEMRQLEKWVREQVNYAKKHGEARTWWAGELCRHRPLWDIDVDEEGSLERASFNTPVQGSAAYYNHASLAAVVRWIEDEGVDARVVIPVHDSLVIEARLGEARDAVVEAVPRIMTGWYSADVPLVVDVDEGFNWGSLEKVAA